MRPQDKTVFLEAAKKFHAWILVRRTNRASLPYIGRPGYMPKRIDCKAKTADVDVGRYQLAGLVVDASIHPGAFGGGKAAKALAAWKSMLPLQGRAYTVDQNPGSKHYGCLLCEGKYIHGDYDLYDIVDMTQPYRNLALVGTLLGQPHKRGPLVLEVQAFVNTRIGTPMIQHGGEAQYANHSEQSLDAFGPEGQDVTILNEYSVRGWYEDLFQGRRTLGK